MNVEQQNKKRFLKRLAFVATVILLLAGIFAAIRVKNEASEKLATIRAEQIHKDEIPFVKTTRSPLSTKQIQIWQNTNNIRNLAFFNRSYFAATDGGLVQLSETGERQKHFTVLDGLPESDLTCLAVFQAKLFIGTRASGLLTFDGEQFQNYRWKDREAKSVDALLAGADDKLLIGTFAGGLIEFDGRAFREIKADNKRVRAINFLSKNAEKLFIGTFENGLWIREAGRSSHFTASDGLGSNRVVGVVTKGEQVLVATDLGVSSAKLNDLSAANQNSPKVFRQLAVIPALSSLTSFNNQIFAVQNDGEIFALASGGKKSFEFKNAQWNKPEKLTNSNLTIKNNNLFLTSAAGIWQLENNNSFVLSLTPFGATQKESLSNNVVSALAADPNGNLWVGTFRNGVEVLNIEGQSIKHLENDFAREINFLVPQKETGEMLVATASGVSVFDAQFRAANFNKTDGLLSNSVMNIAIAKKPSQKTKDELFFATSRGLSSLQSGKTWRGLTSVNGLPSDNAGALAFYKNSLFVGTLGGLAQIENNRVVRTFKDSNSNLSPNWVTALCVSGERLFIGTYGGGIFELTAAGELHAFSSETGKFSVNPNAMVSDGKRLYVGTLDGAWALDLNTQKWQHLRDELPAPTVLSVASDGGSGADVYFGTTGGIARINKHFWTNDQNETKNENF